MPTAPSPSVLQPEPGLTSYPSDSLKNGRRISPRSDDLFLGGPGVSPFAKPFCAQSAERMGALGKYEVVLGTLFSMQIVRIGGDILLSIPNVMEKAHYAAFTRTPRI